MVTLAEDLFLLACSGLTGQATIPVSHLDLGLGGAVLLDLALRGQVASVDDQVIVVSRSGVGDPLLDPALDELAGSARREPEHWVRRFAHGTRGVVRRRLVEAGVLLAEDHRVLGVLAVHHLHRVDDRLEHELVHRLYDAVVLGRRAAPETAALTSLALAVGLQRHLFPRADRRAVRHRMQQIAEGEWVGAAVGHAITALDVVLGSGVDPGLAGED